MRNFKDIILKEDKFLLISTFLLCLLPISILAGSLVSNFILVLLFFSFLSYCFIRKKLSLFQNKIFFILLFFWAGLIINFFFSEFRENSFSRTFGFFRFLILSISVYYIFNFKNIYLKNIILNFWFITFLIVIIDLIIEFSLGKNILGYSSNYLGRLASFTGDELKIGHFFLAFSFIFISTVYEKTRNFKIAFFSISIILILSFLIGERANFLKLLLISNLFLFFVFFFSKKLKFFFILNLLIFLIGFSFISLNKIYNLGDKLDYYDNRYNIRYFKEFERILDSSLIEYIKNDTRHGLHYYTALNIFKENKITGVGLKNFRKFSMDEKFVPQFSNKVMHSTHPHQVILEILSEMGLLGATFFLITFIYSFIISFKSNMKKKYFIGISATLFILISFLPLIPSGSFFTSYGATLFWINFGLMFKNSDQFS